MNAAFKKRNKFNKINLKNSDSIKNWLDSYKRLYFFKLPIFILILMIFYPDKLINSVFNFLNILFILCQLFKFFLLIIYLLLENKIALFNNNNLLSHHEQLTKCSIREKANYYPIYTILLPVYKEGKVIIQLINAIKNLEYPSNKLEVKLLIEEDDDETLKALEEEFLPLNFEIVMIPSVSPRTKAKACNYALEDVKGEYIVVYDAEDLPDKLQLKETVKLFNKLPNDYICIQASLNYYNRECNLLTKFFSIEYSMLFDFFLPVISYFNMPIPLGGSSNHFRVDKLIELGGWDPHNVTEDADLGLKMHRNNYKCFIIKSKTLEEAPITAGSWIKQRARWIKGHILTSLLNLHKFKKYKLKCFITLLFFFYLPNLTYLLGALLILSCAYHWQIPEFSTISKISLGLMIAVPVCTSFVVVFINNWQKMLDSIIFSWLYYLLYPIAAIRSFWQIIFKPYFWDKTDHGKKM